MKTALFVAPFLAANLDVVAAVGFRGTARAQQNPIRKVVNMLQAMQKKVQEEGEKEKDLFEKFQCYCKRGRGDLEKSIAAAKEKGPAVGSNIDQAEARLDQTKQSLEDAQKDRDAANDAMKEASALREKEAAKFAASKKDSDADTAALRKAIAAISKGMGGSFIQSESTAYAAVKRLVSDSQYVSDVDRRDVLAFLQGTASSEYAPQSGSILGILQQLLEGMEKDHSENSADEAAAVKSFEGLMAAKTKEVKAIGSAIESKTQLAGELGVQIVQMKEDLSDTQEALRADEAFMAELEKGCETKAKEWDERSKMRAEELVALADTIKVLNDDDALDLFKQTLPSAKSFVQMDTRYSTLRARALEMVRGVRGNNVGLDFIALALSGKKSLNKGGFDKVVKMIDDMVDLLNKEQADDEHKKEYCAKEFEVADDNQKDLERELSQGSDNIESTEEAIKELASDIAELVAGIKELDGSVADATEQRKQENAEYKELMASDGAAKELLGWAKNRLNKFYNPNQYVAPKAQELSREDQIYVANGGTPPPTEAPGGIAGTGISVGLIQLQSSKGAPAPPPATWDAYQAKGEQTNGVISMIDLLVKDLDKEMTEAEVEEKDSQADYEKMMEQSGTKRTADSKLVAEKTSAKADGEADLEAHKESHAATGKELLANGKYIASLHSECDWLVKHFDTRKDARTNEIESLKRAKAVLHGASYAQVSAHAA